MRPMHHHQPSTHQHQNKNNNNLVDIQIDRNTVFLQTHNHPIHQGRRFEWWHDGPAPPGCSCWGFRVVQEQRHPQQHVRCPACRLRTSRPRISCSRRPPSSSAARTGRTPLRPHRPHPHHRRRPWPSSSGRTHAVRGAPCCPGAIMQGGSRRRYRSPPHKDRGGIVVGATRRLRPGEKRT